MIDILSNLDDKRGVIGAIEGNAAELLLAMGRAGGGDEVHEPHITWTIGGSPIDYHNAVVHADLSRTTLTPDAVITDVIDQFRAHNVAGSWHVGPSFRPGNIGELLVKHGFNHAGDEPGMAADLQQLNEGIHYLTNLQIERVREDEHLDTWGQTLAQGFGEGEREAHWVRDVYRKIGLGDDVPFRHYIGWLNGKAIATTTLFLGAGVAGIYFVMTVPEARRQGIGAAITLAALREARAMGYHVGVLGSSQAGFAVYQRLGFQEYCRIGIYEWQLNGG
jgi:ribosomal protein S18 acetylase RimI-like enzyme